MRHPFARRHRRRRRSQARRTPHSPVPAASSPGAAQPTGAAATPDPDFAEAAEARRRRREARAERRRRKQRRRRIAFITAGAIGLIIVAAAVYLGLRSIQAIHQAKLARAAAQRIEADITSGGPITADVAAYQQAATKANDDTHDPVWTAVSWLPPIQTVRGITHALQQLGAQVLPPIAKVAPTVTPAKLRVNGHTIDVAALRKAAPQLHVASAQMDSIVGSVAALPGGWLSPLTTARDELLSQASSLAGSLKDAAGFARIGPGMLGANGPRTYFIAVQNPAESRGTGGLLGAYVLVRADHGTLHVLQHGNHNQLVDPSRPVTHVPAGFDRMYGLYDATRTWVESNLSPNFPDVASVWGQMWQQTTHQHIDGAAAVTPAALGRLLAVTGPVRDPVFHELVGAKQIAPLIEQKEYAAFGFGASQDHARKAYLTKLATAVIHRLLAGTGDPTALLHALATSAGTGDLQLFSPRPAEERVLRETPIAGALPNTPAPFASVTVDNDGGTKLDYYLTRNFSYQSTGCSAGRRQTTVTASLTNNAPLRGLPPFVRSRPDTDHVIERIPNEPLLVFIDATRGARLTRLTVNGRTVGVLTGVADDGHPVFSTKVTVPPGRTVTLTAYLDEPASAGTATTKVQPLATPQTSQIDVQNCA